MTNRISIWLLMVMLTATSAPIFADAPAATTAPADSAAQAISQAQDINQASSAYAKACSADRNNPVIHEAYMRRLLQLGLPQLALAPANVLVDINKDHALAWGVIGYNEGRRRRFAEATAAAALRSTGEADNSGIMHNLGALTALYEADEAIRKKLPADAGKTLSDLRSKLQSQQAYAKGAAEAADALAKQAQVRSDWDAKIAAAQVQADALKAQVEDFNKQAKAMEEEFTKHQQALSGYQSELSSVNRDIDDAKQNNRSTSSLLTQRTNLRNAITTETEAIAKVRRDAAELTGKGNVAAKEYQTKLREIEKLRFEADREVAASIPASLMTPPAVDGVVTPEREPPAITGASTPTSGTASGPADDAQLAKQLQMAELYIRNGMKTKAAEILNKIVTDAPGSDAAKRAKELLDGLK